MANTSFVAQQVDFAAGGFFPVWQRHFISAVAAVSVQSEGTHSNASRKGFAKGSKQGKQGSKERVDLASDFTSGFYSGEGIGGCEGNYD